MPRQRIIGGPWETSLSSLLRSVRPEGLKPLPHSLEVGGMGDVISHKAGHSARLQWLINALKRVYIVEEP
jgi:hypothetical protein